MASKAVKEREAISKLTLSISSNCHKKSFVLKFLQVKGIEFQFALFEDLSRLKCKFVIHWANLEIIVTNHFNGGTIHPNAFFCSVSFFAARYFHCRWLCIIRKPVQ